MFNIFTLFIKRIFLVTLVLATLVVGISLTPKVSAHTSGVSLEKVVGDYLIDIAYSPEVLFEDSLARFDFSILNDTTKIEQTFTDIWVRIESGERTLFAGGLYKARFGPTGLSYAFPDAGDYTISVRYSNATSTLAESSFDLTVYEMAKEPSVDWLFWSKVIGTTVLGTVLIVLLYWLGGRYWQRRQGDKPKS